MLRQRIMNVLSRDMQRADVFEKTPDIIKITVS